MIAEAGRSIRARSLWLALLPTALALVLAAPAGASIEIHDATASEGEGAIRFPLELTCDATTTCTYRFRTIDGTAVNDLDYYSTNEWFENGTLAPGETSVGDHTIMVAEDAIDEPDEQFQVEWQEEVDGHTTSALATGTIVDDDNPPPPPQRCPAEGPVSRPVRAVALNLANPVSDAIDELNCKVIVKFGL